MQSQDKLRITIPYTTLWIGLMLTAVAVIWLSWMRNWQLPIDEAVKVIATGVGVTTALYVAMNLARLNQAHAETVELKKLELTAKMIERWQDPKTAEACLPLAVFLRDNRSISTDEIAKKIDADNSLSANALFVLNTLEGLAVQLKYGALQHAMCHAFFRGIVTTYYTSLAGLVALARTRKANARLYTELELLSQAWAK